jgi:hypothetical protein
MKKILLSFILFYSLLLSEAFASHPLEGWCIAKTEQKTKNLEFWINKNAEDGGKNAVILAGKIEEVRLTYNGNQAGSCWAKMNVTEWLWGQTKKSIWISVRVGEPAVNAFGNGFKDLDYCELQKNKEYVVYGRSIYSPNQEYTPDNWVAIFSSRISSRLPEHGFYCPPHTELTDKNRNKLLKNIRKIINSK